MSVTFLSPEMKELVCRDAVVERVASGFMFTEGPIWMNDGSLHFSDMPADVRRRWHSKDGSSIVRQPAHKCNGMTRDSKGALIVCEHSTSRVIREDASGSTVIASHYNRKELNSPNDVIAASDDSILFSDPDWGRTYAIVGLERPVELDFRGVFRAPPDGGDLQLIADDFEGPNGLCFSPDEKLLYVNDTIRAHIRVFDVSPSFEFSNSGVFVSGIGEGIIGQGVVDGMKADERGNIYVTGPGGIWVFNRGGKHIGILEIPEETANLNWGDEDWKSLYIAASTSIYRIRMNVGGNRLPYMK